MNAEHFFAEWSANYGHLTMNAADVSHSFGITSSQATAMLQSLVKSGKVVGLFYSQSRRTVYSINHASNI